jgi:hypothetical protein
MRICKPNEAGLIFGQGSPSMMNWSGFTYVPPAPSTTPMPITNANTGTSGGVTQNHTDTSYQGNSFAASGGTTIDPNTGNPSNFAETPGGFATTTIGGWGVAGVSNENSNVGSFGVGVASPSGQTAAFGAAVAEGPSGAVASATSSISMVGNSVVATVSVATDVAISVQPGAVTGVLDYSVTSATVNTAVSAVNMDTGAQSTVSLGDPTDAGSLGAVNGSDSMSDSYGGDGLGGF